MSIKTFAQDELLTHSTKHKPFDLSVHQERLASKENLTWPLDVEMKLLEQLSEFDLGQFLLENKGLDGRATAYVILHAPKLGNLHPLEEWLVLSAPFAIATRERFHTFQTLLQMELKNHIRIASIPCGTMDDLLGLDYTDFEGIELVGIDLDKSALKPEEKNISFLQRDAWQLNAIEEYDIITSNGLNIYEKEGKRVIALYREFFKALKPGGVLVTSFLTPPPMLSRDSSWKNFNPQDLIKQKVLLSDIIEGNFQSFRTEEEVKEQLEAAGFEIELIVYDTQGMFPAVVVKKPTL